MEFLPKGDLYHLIHSKLSDEEYNRILRLKIGIDIAKGMRYLQSITPPVIHRDLRSPNVLVFYYFNPLIIIYFVFFLFIYYLLF